MPAPQLIYCLVSLILISYSIYKAENKWFLGAVLTWMLSLPIIDDPRFTIPLPVAGIELQASRILFLFLLIVLFIVLARARFERKSLRDLTLHRIRFYELLMIIFLLITFAITVININFLGAQTVVVNLVKLSTFLLIYFFARESISPKDFSILSMVIIVFALESSIVGTYQFFINPSFFRVGSATGAFGSYIRGNGLFFSEYDQGLFLTIALIVGLTMIRNIWGKALIIVMLLPGVFCTMHRGSWLIFASALVIILVRNIRWTFPLILIGAFASIVLLLIVLNTPLDKIYSGSFVQQLITQRVEANTLDIRMNLNRFAIGLIQKHPLGIGDYASSIYVDEAYKLSILFVQGNPLVVHNGLLATGVQYGIAGMIFFSLFIFATIVYYLSNKRWATNIGLMAGLVMLSFFMINMTQDLSFLGEPRNLFLGLLLGSALSVSSYTINHNPVSSPRIVT